MSTFTTTIQHCTQSPSQIIRKEKEIKDMQIWNEEVKVSLFINDNTIYRFSQIIVKKVSRTNK